MSWLSTAISGVTGGLSAKVIIYGVIAVLCIGGIGTIYFSITHMAKKNQELSDEVKDMKKVIAQQQITIKQTQDLADQNNKSIEDMNVNISTIHSKFEAIDTYLTSPSTIAKDKPASDLLKKTIESLNKGLK